MSTRDKPISIAEAISATPLETSDGVEAWHLEKITERKLSADKGEFAPAEAVQAVIRKYVRDE